MGFGLGRAVPLGLRQPDSDVLLRGHSRAAVDPSDPALRPLAVVRQGASPQISIDALAVRNLTQNRRNIFHLNCVPRQYHIACPGHQEGMMRETLKETHCELALSQRTAETIQRHPPIGGYKILLKMKGTPAKGEPTKPEIKITVAR